MDSFALRRFRLTPPNHGQLRCRTGHGTDTAVAQPVRGSKSFQKHAETHERVLTRAGSSRLSRRASREGVARQAVGASLPPLTGSELGFCGFDASMRRCLVLPRKPFSPRALAPRSVPRRIAAQPAARDSGWRWRRPSRRPWVVSGGQCNAGCCFLGDVVCVGGVEEFCGWSSCLMSSGCWRCGCGLRDGRCRGSVR